MLRWSLIYARRMVPGGFAVLKRCSDFSLLPPFASCPWLFGRWAASGCTLDIISTRHGLTCRLASSSLAPGLFTLPDTLRAALPSCPGAVVFGPRANSRRPDFSIPPDLGPSLPGLDARVARVESLPPGSALPLANGGKFVHWAEDLEGKAEVVLLREDNRAAMVRAGGLQYLGGWPSDATLFSILSDLCAAQGIATRDLPSALRTRSDGKSRFWFNHGASALEWEGLHLPPASMLRVPA